MGLALVNRNTAWRRWLMEHLSSNLRATGADDSQQPEGNRRRRQSRPHSKNHKFPTEHPTWEARAILEMEARVKAQTGAEWCGMQRQAYSASTCRVSQRYAHPWSLHLKPRSSSLTVAFSLSSRCLTTSNFPPKAATASGVVPLRSGKIARRGASEAAAVSIASTHSRCPLLAA